jgi:ribonucleoside-triphosphate reductase
VSLKPDPTAVADYIHASKYARYVPELQRRELYDETVARVELMHMKRFPELRQEINEAFDLVREKKVLPSMRSMQFGGQAIEVNNARQYNCSSTLVDRPRVFAEAMFLLLSGCGVGYSVQYEHVEKLPEISYVDNTKVVHHVIDDTIEGWANAVDALVNAYLGGYLVEFSYHLIRSAGTPLKTSGGRAPGHRKLRKSLERIRAVLHGAQGRQLRPIECHRIMCHAADAVLSGGIRRSAMIALFSFEDSEMMNCKADPDWYANEPWLANSNNSVVFVHNEVTERQYRRVFQFTRKFGEPGFVFVAHPDHVYNPCSEVGMDPVLVQDDGSRATGWSMCNLTEMNASKFKTLKDFKHAAKAAALIGTLQAAYTSFPYLGEVTEKIVRRDALIGVGMTGMQDSPEIALNPAYQREVADLVVQINSQIAAILGIRRAARATVIKPAGTTSLALGCVGSGIHFHHAKRYIRRVTADGLEFVFQAFMKVNPHMCQKMPNGKWVVEFAVEAPEGARLKDDFSAVEFLEMVRSTQQNWVVPGTTRESRVPGLRHNVSNTVQVRDGEWSEVADFLWKHRTEFTGVSMLPATGDQIYAFAPFEAVKTEAQQRRWDDILRSYIPVDYYGLLEAEDGTALTGEASCANGSCER